MAESPERTGNFVGHDGLKIFYRQFQAVGERARLVIAHGLGEHSGRYGNVVNRLLPRGISIWIPDHRGHGRSEGKRGHILTFEQYHLDLRLMIESAREGLAEGGKVFLLGHSMGGLIALYLTLQSPELIDGVIVSSPGLGMAIEVPGVKILLGKAMSFLWPGLTMSSALDATKISHDKEVVRAYENDPLVHDRVSVRWFTEFSSAMKTLNQRASEVSVPILMQVAGNDHLVSAQASELFFQKLKVNDKTLYVYEGSYHEIYNESENQKEKALNDLEKWLENHIE
ncbi:MAG: lysophospholipase [Deltaproteobacteria bacterium]|nr:lysophospholipase [Deltaproteobacteria bacterium]MBW2121269.1 lysophospholipase [Deltaproteobacteria bacterium]